MTRVVLVCRGSAEIGLGHVMRCRTVATALTGNASVHVVTLGDPDICANLLSPLVPFTHAEDDRDAVRVAARHGAEVIAFDMLEFAPDAFDRIPDAVTTVCLSPIFNLLDRVDLAFTRAMSPVHESLLARGRPVIRAGCRYTTISPHCRRVDTEVYRRGLSMQPLAVAVSMGGADAPNHTLRILETVRDLDTGILFWVMLGEGYTHSYQRLVDCVRADRRHEIILAKTNNSMWRILGGCSVAILLGGITTFEAAFAGIPSIIALGRDRDRFLVRELVDAGACICAGAPFDAALPGVATALAHVNRNRDELLAMHTRCKNLLDSDGPRRVATEIIEFHAPGAIKREAVTCASV